MFRRFGISFVLIASAALGGCGGSGGSGPASAVPPQSSPTTAPMAPVSFSVAIPGKTPGKHGRLPLYVSANTYAASISYTPAGGTRAGPIFVVCTTQCTANFNAPVGVDQFDVTLVDPQSHPLSHGVTTAVISASSPNTIAVTFNGIVQSAALRVVPASLPAGTPATALLFVDARDADNNTILTDGTYVDANGAQVLFNVADADTSHATSISAPGVSAPGSIIPVTYTGAISSGATFTLTSASTIPGGLTGTSLAVAPTITSAIAISPAPGFGPTEIYSEGDGISYYGIVRFPNQNDTGSIDIFVQYIPIAFDTAHGFDSSSETAAQGDSPGIVWSPSLHALFQGGPGNKITRMPANLNGTSVTTALPRAGDFVAYVAIGPDGNLYYTATSQDPLDPFTGDVLGFVDQNFATAPTEIAVPSGFAGSSKLIAASDGNLWFIESATNKVAFHTPGTGSITELSLPNAGDRPTEIVDSPLHNAVFVLGTSGTTGNATIWKIQFAGHVVGVWPVTLPATLVSLHAQPDLTLWSIDPVAAQLVRIEMTTRNVTTLAPSNAGAYFGGAPVEMTFAPDGTIWYATGPGGSVQHVIP